jgi:hypothetical protein
LECPSPFSPTRDHCFLNLLWFAAALSTDLRDAGKGGWATAATASSAALGAVLFLRMVVRAALAYSIAGSGSPQVTSGLADLAWATSVIVSFPAAMFIMAGSFGLWRAEMISKAAFGAGVAAVVLVLLGGTTWAHDGFWAPDGAYAVLAGIILVVWLVVVSGFLVMRMPSTAGAREQAPFRRGSCRFEPGASAPRSDSPATRLGRKP